MPQTRHNIKLLLRTLALLLVLSTEVAAQWTKVAVPTIEDLLDVHFVNPSVGWVVGTGGIILHTSDGGISWQAQVTEDTTQWFHCIFAVDEDNAWAVGDTLILRTSDAGVTWSRVHIDVPLYGKWYPSSALFIDKDTGWIAGWYFPTPPQDSSFVLKTVNGGVTWSKQYLPRTFGHSNGLDVSGSSHVWLSDTQALLRTVDGMSWETVLNISDRDLIYGVDFVTDAVGYLTVSAYMGIGVIWRTNDSGKTWTLLRESCTATMFASFTDTLRGWAVNYSCADNATEIWHTTNSGAEWVMQLEYPVSHDYQGPKRIKFLDSLNGWMVGSKGMMFYTSNGGLTGVKDAGELLPAQVSLSQNYPNPFNPSTTISYALPAQAFVSLKVFNVLGQEVTTLVNGIESPGYKSVRFDGSGLPSGVYFYRLQAGSYSSTKMLMIVK